jgi:hypothetical protein
LHTWRKKRLNRCYKKKKNIGRINYKEINVKDILKFTDNSNDSSNVSQLP